MVGAARVTSHMDAYLPKTSFLFSPRPFEKSCSLKSELQWPEREFS